MDSANKPGWNNRFLSWFGFIMVACYIVLGLVILTGDYFRNSMEGNYRLALGTLIIAYGLFRGWRIIQNRRSTRDQEQ